MLTQRGISRFFVMTFSLYGNNLNCDTSMAMYTWKVYREHRGGGGGGGILFKGVFCYVTIILRTTMYLRCFLFQVSVYRFS